jgi:endonuclease/exonuclease/phosphatase (EEP) superfamily protein YafD
MRLTDLKPRFAGLLQAGAFVTAVFSLATLADHLHRYLELFSHFRLQYLAVALILSALLFALRNRRWAALMLVVAAINTVPVAPWYMAEAEATVVSGPAIKLLLSNVYSGNRNSQALVDLVLDEDPDVVFLQELTGKRSRELAALRDIYTYSLNIPREDNFGIAVLSRHPFAGARVIESPPFQLPTLLVEIEIADRAIAFVTTHPLPPIGKTGFESRNTQLASIAELVNQIAGPRVLIGDLNTTMWGEHYRLLIEETGLVDSRYGLGVLPTWPTHLPFAMIPIDHCLVSREFEVMDFRTGPDIGSDHLPVLIELAIGTR